MPKRSGPLPPSTDGRGAPFAGGGSPAAVAPARRLRGAAAA